jgi:Spy/CpxP family protein refolding chaperone
MKRFLVVLVLLTVLAPSTLIGQGPPGAAGPPPQPGRPNPPDPFGRFVFPPELVMQHQAEIALQDSQRVAIQQAIQNAQGKFLEVQWKLSSEGEKLARILQSPTVNEAQALDQVDRILALEREIKRGQMALVIRIKNALTPAQQAKLDALRGGGPGGP